MSIRKARLDSLLVEKGLVRSRSLANSLILEGKVFVDGDRVDKAGTKIPENCEITIKGDTRKWVSRGAWKLLGAMDVFGTDPKDKVCLDVGSSTGGFCQVLLTRGAAKVYSVDVGYGQLAWLLRNDPRVVVMERTNARDLTPDIIPEKIDLVTIDVSFISVRKILPVIEKLIHDDGRVITLVKPQFEAGREKVGKKGVIRDPNIHHLVLKDLTVFIAENTSFQIKSMYYSPIKGPQGNIEFLFYLAKGEENSTGYYPLSEMEKVLMKAHENLMINK